MKKGFSKTTLVLALAGTIWAPASQACSVEPYIGDVCLHAWNYGGGWGNGTYVPANGAIVPVSQNQVLYAVIGCTYGGDCRSTFGLPNLQGRVVVGAGTAGGYQYPVGGAGGSPTATLTQANLPAHTHDLSSATVNTSKLGVSTSLGGVTGTLAGAASLKASNGGNRVNDPTGRTLATTAGPTAIYSDATPTIGMMGGSIDTSGLSVSFNGNPTSTLTGTASVAGTSAPTGQGGAFSIMQPYMSMYYYIAVTGQFPTRD